MEHHHGLLHWEKLCIGEPKHELMYSTVHRCSVPGGWLVALLWSTGHQAGGPALAFVPDPEHVWDGNSIPNELAAKA